MTDTHLKCSLAISLLRCLFTFSFSITVIVKFVAALVAFFRQITTTKLCVPVRQRNINYQITSLGNKERQNTKLIVLKTDSLGQIGG